MAHPNWCSHGGGAYWVDAPGLAVTTHLRGFLWKTGENIFHQNPFKPTSHKITIIPPTLPNIPSTDYPPPEYSTLPRLLHFRFFPTYFVFLVKTISVSESIKHFMKKFVRKNSEIYTYRLFLQHNHYNMLPCISALNMLLKRSLN